LDSISSMLAFIFSRWVFALSSSLASSSSNICCDSTFL
jgi:hypothetical protein